MCGSIVDIQSPTGENRRGKKDTNHSCKTEWPAITIGGHNKQY